VRHRFLRIGDQAVGPDHQQLAAQQPAAIGLPQDRPGRARQLRHAQGPRQPRSFVRRRSRPRQAVLQLGLPHAVGRKPPLRLVVPPAEARAVSRPVMDFVKVLILANALAPEVVGQLAPVALRIAPRLVALAQVDQRPGLLVGKGPQLQHGC
jgi:hypothetical protein